MPEADEAPADDVELGVDSPAALEDVVEPGFDPPDALELVVGSAAPELDDVE
ncbi:MAG: hypothetical protein JWM66_1392 [Solirubrobacterales bacterium]|jgi:hypothetical protein|nr:hypothetical protein [Solirubrobacterales bacterium]